MNSLENTYCYSFPAIRAVQANKPFFVATCPLSIIPKIFMYDEEEVPAELRAQRTLNKGRIPEMTRYLLESPDNYVFSAITASVGTEVEFEEHPGSRNIGTLKVPMDAQILINDGQHRRAAIEEAIKENAEIGQDNIAVLFFVDEGLKRSQQMFADLNKYAVRPSASLSTLYDHRDQASELARYLAMTAKPFVGFTEFEKTSISNTSAKIFTLSGIKHAARALLGKGPKDGFTESEKETNVKFWEMLNNFMPEWQQVQNKSLSASEFRRDYISAHGIGLQALAMVGRNLLEEDSDNIDEMLNKLKSIDWRKANSQWSNRAMQHGRLSKSMSNKFLTALEIKRQIGLSVTQEELEKEKGLMA